MKIGIVGPSRRNQGTGGFVARFLHEAGASVSAVCATTQASAEHAAVDLGAAFGCRIRPFGSMEEMLARCDLDAVAICSPVPCHEDHLWRAAKAGLHVFCEKPLIWTGAPGIAELVADLTRTFEDRGLVLHQNTQWTFIIDDLASIVGKDAIPPTESFEMMMAPPAPGLSMFWEAAPHPVSLMVALGATGSVSDLVCRCAEDLTSLTMEFIALRCGNAPLHARVVLQSQATQPRPCYLKLDGVLVQREILSLSPYEWALRAKGSLRPIQDPLRRSVQHFVRRCVTSDVRSDGDGIVRQFRLLEALWHTVSPATMLTRTVKTEPGIS